jgi:DNA polymerase-3 subunit epsilon
MKFIAIDFETANSSRTSACSIGITFVENKKVVETKHFYIKTNTKLLQLHKRWNSRNY